MADPAPDGYPKITTYLCVDGAADASESMGRPRRARTDRSERLRSAA